MPQIETPKPHGFASPAQTIVTGHFGEWLQGRMGPDGPVALVTLPCPVLSVSAPATPPAPALFDAEALARFGALLGRPVGTTGTHRQMPAGAGTGASTATLVALARASGYSGPPETLAAACRAVEGATDPLMFPDPDRLLWASREARVLRPLPAPPPFDIAGGFWGDPIRTDPDDADFPDISDLVPAWERATDALDLAETARIATLSATRTTRLRGPSDPMADLAQSLGALGHIRAHTGSARGLVFAPGTIPPHTEDTLKEAGLTGCLTFRTGAR